MGGPTRPIPLVHRHTMAPRPPPLYPVDTIVWAKVPGFAWWPARVADTTKTHVKKGVQFIWYVGVPAGGLGWRGGLQHPRDWFCVLGDPVCAGCGWAWSAGGVPFWRCRVGLGALHAASDSWFVPLYPLHVPTLSSVSCAS